MKFISVIGKNGEFVNLDMLLELELNYPGIFVKTIEWFNCAKLYRKGIKDDGKPTIVPWKKALERFFLEEKYKRVTSENEDIAEIFGRLGISQKIFDMTSDARNRAVEEEVPEHILGRELKEREFNESNDKKKSTEPELQIKQSTKLEQVEEIMGQTREELKKTQNELLELYDSYFSYEWLSKRDPRNAILGILCSCCATINSVFYGGNIALSSIKAPDVQNLVIRNNKGDIIAKVTVYVNKQSGYMVLNSFELNVEYKKGENGIGRYSSSENSKEERMREAIFSAFKRGINDFIIEYDKENPENPITQVNIGMNYNRLKRQMDRYKPASTNLDVPIQYGFEDCNKRKQYVFFKKSDEEHIK